MPFSRKKAVYWLLLSASLLWLGAALAAPVFENLGLERAGLADRVFFQAVCHQLPERSPGYWGHKTAVCARCLGLYSGFLGGLLLFPRLPALRRKLLKHPKAILLFALPMAMDLVLWENTHWSRFYTGAAAALPVALLAWVAARQLVRSAG